MCPGSDVPSYGITIDSTVEEKSSAALLKHSLLLPQVSKILGSSGSVRRNSAAL
jgi:hypothetical protein